MSSDRYLVKGQTDEKPPSGPAQRLSQETPTEDKSLAVTHDGTRRDALEKPPAAGD